MTAKVTLFAAHNYFNGKSLAEQPPGIAIKGG